MNLNLLVGQKEISPKSNSAFLTDGISMPEMSWGDSLGRFKFAGLHREKREVSFELQSNEQIRILSTRLCEKSVMRQSFCNASLQRVL